jgi:hypothetical protein
MSRFIFLDESGTGDIKRGPHLVVTGIITDLDRDWKRVNEHMAEIAKAHAVDRRWRYLARPQNAKSWMEQLRPQIHGSLKIACRWPSRD